MPLAFSDKENPTSDEISEYLGENPRVWRFAVSFQVKTLKTEGMPFTFSDGEKPYIRRNLRVPL